MKRILFSLLVLVGATASANQFVRTSSEGSVKLSVDVLPASGMPSSELDVLFVIDDSGSMQTHQANVSAQVPALVSKLAMTGVDMHVGVMTTSMSYSGGTGGPRTDGKLVNGYVESKDPMFARKLSTNMMVGTQGSGTETLFAPVMAGLSEPLLSGENAGFLRPSAPLAVVFVTDADDQSAETAADLKTFLTKLRSTAFRTVAAYIPRSVVPTTCDRSGEAEPMKLEEFLDSTNGSKITLCDATMGEQIVGAIASMIVPNPNPGPAPIYDRVIELPSKAVLSSIKVVYDNTTLAFGDLHAGWVFDSQKNAIVIGEGVPLGNRPWTTKIEIEYQIANWP